MIMSTSGFLRQRNPRHSSTAASAASVEEKKKERKKKNDGGVGVNLVVSLVLIWTLSFAVVHHRHHSLPAARASVQLAPAETPDQLTPYFSEEKTRFFLAELLSFGSRPVGSTANEKLTPQLILQTIQTIQREAALLSAQKARLEVQLQTPQGAFGLDFLSQFQNVYANVTNIIVRYTPTTTTRKQKEKKEQAALLISSHFDSAPHSKGGSDDGVNVAIMLELLRVLTLNPPVKSADVEDRSDDSIIFLFNGAEETILQAAHGFITQHPWSTSNDSSRLIKAFINLEAAGAGGRELLFQTGSPRLSEAYAKVAKYPYGSTLAQEVFQSGIIPSDTDYRIYRDYGDLPGMDFAYIANGYVYHTYLDDLAQIQPGVIQRTGENLFAVITEILSSNVLSKIEPPSARGNEKSKHIFFDVLGMFMINIYSSTNNLLCYTVFIICTLYLLNSIADSPKKWIKNISQKTLQLMAISVFTCISAVCSGTLLSFYAPLSWYANPILILFLFALPTLIGYIISFQFFMQKNGLYDKNTNEILMSAAWEIEEYLFECNLLFWFFTTVILFVCQSGSTYIFSFWVILPLVGRMLAKNFSSSAVMYFGLYYGWLVIPLLLTMQIMMVALEFFIPLMGRSGTFLPPDIIVSAIISFFFLILFSFFGVSLCFVSVSTFSKIKKILIAIYLLAVLVACLINPYSTSCPKRVFVQHIHRTFIGQNQTIIKEDSGLWVNAFDFIGTKPLQDVFKTTKWKDALVAPQNNKDSRVIYDNFPWILPLSKLLPLKHSVYIPTSPPILSKIEHETSLEVLSSSYTSKSNRRRIHFLLKGPSHMTMSIDAKNTTLTSWSIGKGLMDGVPKYQEDSYFLHFANGVGLSRFNFWIEVEGSQPVLIAFSGHYFHLKETNLTEELNFYQKSLPTYMTGPYFVSKWTQQEV